MALIIYHNAIISYSGCVVFNIGVVLIPDPKGPST